MDEAQKLEDFRARVQELEEELYEPYCGVCGRWVNVLCHDEVWTCPCHNAVCDNCWPGHRCST